MCSAVSVSESSSDCYLANKELSNKMISMAIPEYTRVQKAGDIVMKQHYSFTPSFDGGGGGDDIVKYHQQNRKHARQKTY